MTFKLPTSEQRLCVIGRTGSGKTRMGAWVLSHAPLDRMPYVVVDYKGEKLFNRVDRIRDIGFSTVPTLPGLYRISPREDEADEMEAWLWKVHRRGRTGLFFDETTQLPGHYRAGAVRALFSQGRSKRIPIIACTQRPSGVSPSLFSEADHFSVFHLNKRADIQKVRENTTDALEGVPSQPRYHSRWFDVNDDALYDLLPVEGDDRIIERFNWRLRLKHRVW